MNHEWCQKCHNYLLTIEQMETTHLCERCEQQRHADTFIERIQDAVNKDKKEE